MSQVEGFQIEQVLRGGAIDAGERVFFTASMMGGGEASFFVPTEYLGKLLFQIIKLGTLAAEEQTKAGKPDVGRITSAPLHAVNFGWGVSVDPARPAFLLRIESAERIPLDLAIPKDLALQLAGKILEEMNRTPSPKPPSH